MLRGRRAVQEVEVEGVAEFAEVGAEAAVDGPESLKIEIAVIAKIAAPAAKDVATGGVGRGVGGDVCGWSEAGDDLDIAEPGEIHVALHRDLVAAMLPVGARADLAEAGGVVVGLAALVSFRAAHEAESVDAEVDAVGMTAVARGFGVLLVVAAACGEQCTVGVAGGFGDDVNDAG